MRYHLKILLLSIFLMSNAAWKPITTAIAHATSISKSHTFLFKIERCFDMPEGLAKKSLPPIARGFRFKKTIELLPNISLNMSVFSNSAPSLCSSAGRYIHNKKQVNYV